MPSGLSRLSDLELFAQWREVMDEMRARGLIQSTNKPIIGDYAEVLVARALAAERPSGPDTGVDLVTKEGTTVQVKARRDPTDGQATHFDITNLDDRRFESFVGILFAEDFTVRGAWQMRWELINELARPSGRKHRVRIRDIEQAVAGGRDIERLDLSDLSS